MTEKDRLDAPYMPSALLVDIRNRKNGHWGWSNKKAIDKIYERDRFIRAESADQARKEAIKAVNSLDANIPAMRRSSYEEGYGDALEAAERAILGNSAPVSTDANHKIALMMLEKSKEYAE